MVNVGFIVEGWTDKIVVESFTRQHGFAIARAAKHPCCPSAQYFVERVAALGT